MSACDCPRGPWRTACEFECLHLAGLKCVVTLSKALPGTDICRSVVCARAGLRKLLRLLRERELPVPRSADDVLGLEAQEKGMVRNCLALQSLVGFFQSVRRRKVTSVLVEGGGVVAGDCFLWLGSQGEFAGQQAQVSNVPGEAAAGTGIARQRRRAADRSPQLPPPPPQSGTQTMTAACLGPPVTKADALAALGPRMEVGGHTNAPITLSRLDHMRQHLCAYGRNGTTAPSSWARQGALFVSGVCSQSVCA